ncbi:MAG: elongation factor P [bacterium]|nr:elongation factor P [bacterium]
MLSYSELRAGIIFVLDGEPYKVLEYNFLRKQQRKPVAQTKIKSLKTGKVANKTFHQNESFEEAIIEKKPAKYLYSGKGEYWFHKAGSPKDRFKLEEDAVSDVAKWLKPNMEVEMDLFDDKIIGIEVPIKMEFKVIEAPPNVKGDSSTGGNKEVVIETGAKVTVPMFINQDDIIRINTTTGLYAERAEKN